MKMAGFLCTQLDAGNVYNAKSTDIRTDFKLDSNFDSLFANPINIPKIKRSERVVVDPSRVICKYLFHVKCT